MLDVTIQNFEAELINASMQQPILLDIWAPWCGPCKALGPVLEKLEVAYAGRFKLAKLNSDEQPEIASQLSQAFGVRSIPFCVLFDQGQPVDGFVGALPESQIRAFLDKHVPTADELEAEAETEEAEALIAEGDPEAALAKLQQAVAIDPGNDDARYDYVKLLLERGALTQAEAAFAPVAKKRIRVRMAGRPEPVVAWNTPNTNIPIAPPKRSKTPKNPNISPALWRGMRVAKSERDSAWMPPCTVATRTPRTKDCAVVSSAKP